MHTPNFDVYQLLSIISVNQTLFHQCASIRLKFRLISRLMPILHTRGILGRVVVGCLSNAQPNFDVYQLLSITSVRQTLFHQCTLICLKFRLNQQPTLHTRVHTPQLWCLSSPLHHLCLINLVQWVCIDPYKISILPVKRHNLEGRSRQSIKCTPSNFVSISFSPSPLPAKLCSKSVHRSVQEFDIYRTLGRL